MTARPSLTLRRDFGYPGSIRSLTDRRLLRLKSSLALTELTPREREVALLLCERLSGREIANRLCVSRKTVAKHSEHIYMKLGVRGRGSFREQLSADARSPQSDNPSPSVFSPLGFRLGDLGRFLDEADFTPREQEVALLLCARLSVNEMAGCLFISRRTVAKHLEHIYVKLGLHGRSRFYQKLEEEQTGKEKAARRRPFHASLFPQDPPLSAAFYYPI